MWTAVGIALLNALNEKAAPKMKIAERACSASRHYAKNAEKMTKTAMEFPMSRKQEQKTQTMTACQMTGKYKMC